MPLDWHVLCPNRECPTHGEPIPLLIANPERIDNDLAEWPTDGSTVQLACPECRHVSAYSQVDLENLPEDPRTKYKEWIGVTLVCGVEGHKAPFRFHAFLTKSGKAAIRDEVELKVRTGHWQGKLACGCPFSRASHIVIDRLDFWGKPKKG